MAYHTEQESFWAGSFNEGYQDRNQSQGLLAANTAFFSKVIGRTGPISTVFEIGANIGMNLLALRTLIPDLQASAVEINSQACERLREHPWIEVIESSVLQFEPTTKWDLSFSKGVLIHIQPDELKKAYRLLYDASSKWVLVAEYYNPSPVTIPYRGHTDRLFKRDFAGEMLELYADLKLVDYGFLYRRDPVFPQDDISWFLMEKQA